MKTAIVSMLKNEHLYLEEWIQYHLNLGIDFIFLFEDLDSKSHLEITSKYPKVFLHNIYELFEEKEIYRENIQRDLANYFVVNYREDFDWVAFIDIDEYITCNEPLKDILEKYNNNLLMHWVNYNANGHLYRPKGSIIENYTLTCPSLGIDRDKWIYKTFGKLTLNPTWADPHYTSEYINQDEIYIRHYITKSFEDYCYRIYERGDVYHRKYRDFQLFLDANPDFTEEQCLKFVELKYGQMIEEYIQETKYFPEDIKYNSLKTIFKTSDFLLNENSQIFEYIPEIQGTLLINDLHCMLGGYTYVNGKLVLFIHHQRFKLITNCRLLIVNELGQGEIVNIQQELTNKVFDYKILAQTDKITFPNCSGFCSISIQVPKHFGRVYFRCSHPDYYKIKVNHWLIYIEFFSCPKKENEEQEIEIYGENGGSKKIFIHRLL